MGKTRKDRFKGRKFFDQDNGRERGPEDMGDGTFQDTHPMGHSTFTKTREEERRRKARREKMNRWCDEDDE